MALMHMRGRRRETALATAAELCVLQQRGGGGGPPSAVFNTSAHGRGAWKMQEICENLRRAVEHGRTDIVRSILDACEFFCSVFIFFILY